MSLGKWLREERIARRLTQHEAAKRAGISRPLLAKIEAGDQPLHVSKVPGIASALDLDLATVYQRAGYIPPAGIGETDVRFAREIEPLLIQAGERRPKIERAVKRLIEDLVMA